MAAYAPYKYNPAEMPPDEMEATFVGRDRLLDRLMACVREQTDSGTIQHYLLLGPRGIGKTTLLLMLQRRIREDRELSGRWLVVRFREEEFYVYTFRDLLALALENLHTQENLAEAGKALAEAEGQTDDEVSLAILTSALRTISQSRGRRILLLVDNFDRILPTFPKRNQHDVFQRSFRKLLSTESFLMVMGTSTLLFEDIASYDEAFFNFFCPVHVENLTDAEIQELLLARADADHNDAFKRDYDRHKHNVRAITYLTGGNPRLVLMLYEILSRREFQPVVETLRETIDNLTPMLKDVLEDLPRQQSKTLDALMRLDGAASPSRIAEHARLSLGAVTTQLGRLKQAGLVLGEGEGKGRPATYHVRDQMFRTWYQMRYLRPARRRVEMFVEFARAWFSVEERLRSLAELRQQFHDHLASGHPRAGADPHAWVKRLGELEGEETPLGERVEARIDIVAAVARACSPDAAREALDAAMETAGAEVRGRLAFLKPALELARTGDEKVLGTIPVEERQLARTIAARIMEKPEDA